MVTEAPATFDELVVQPGWDWRLTPDPVRRYAEDAVAGRIVVGRLVRLACERHLRDLAGGYERGLSFDVEAGLYACRFMEFLAQRKGEWGGERLRLEAWQVFRIGSVFGWKREDGTRRFSTALHEVARKNGKTTESAGVGLFLLAYDNEPGAEVYVAATKRDQAKECWNEAWWMAGHPKTGTSLRKQIRRLVGQLEVPSTGSKFLPLGMDKDGAHGLNIHGGIFDELHAWRDRAQFEALTTAGGARRQPLIWMITTAGNSRGSIGFEEHDYSIRVLEGKVEDDSWFAYIAAADDPSDWQNPVQWSQANPNLGVSVKVKYLADKVAKAREVTSQLMGFQQLHLNAWMERRTATWMPLQVWDEQPTSSPLAGQEAFGGLVVAAPMDLAAFVLWMPDRVELLERESEDGETLRVSRIPKSGQAVFRFWIPEEGLKRRENRPGGSPLREWAAAREGRGLRTEGREETPWLTIQEGETLDYDLILADILGLLGEYDVKSVGRAPFNSAQIGRQLANADYLDVEIPQTVLRLAEPTRQLEKLLADRELRHEGNPVARWMFDNAVASSDANGNTKLDPAKSGDNVYGLQALVMAISEGMAPPAPPPGVVVWFPPEEDDDETRG